MNHCKCICTLTGKTNVRSKENVFVLQLTRFNAKMAEMDKKIKHELLLIEHQHSKLTVCAVNLQFNFTFLNSVISDSLIAGTQINFFFSKFVP